MYKTFIYVFFEILPGIHVCKHDLDFGIVENNGDTQTKFPVNYSSK
jgi:hypothetical protein